MSRGRESFPRSARLTRRSEFLSVSRGGRRIHTSHFVVICKTSDKGKSRLGVTVSAKVGKAVVRNRIKRFLREFYRRQRYEFPSHQDVVIIARKGADRLSLSQVGEEIRGAFSQKRSRREW